MDENNETPEAGALWYLRTQRDVWSKFVSPEAAARIDAALAEES